MNGNRSSARSCYSRALPARSMSGATTLRYEGYLNPSLRLIRNLSKGRTRSEGSFLDQRRVASAPTHGEVDIWLHKLLNNESGYLPQSSERSREAKEVRSGETAKLPVLSDRLAKEYLPTWTGKNPIASMEESTSRTPLYDSLAFGCYANSGNQSQLNCILRGVNRWNGP